MLEKTEKPDNPLLTANDVAAILNCSVRHVWTMKSEHRIPPPIRLGPRVLRWRRCDIDAFLEREAAAAIGGVA